MPGQPSAQRRQIVKLDLQEAHDLPTNDDREHSPSGLFQTDTEEVLQIKRTIGDDDEPVNVKDMLGLAAERKILPYEQLSQEEIKDFQESMLDY